MCGLLWMTGWLNFSETASAAQILVAVLALVGTMLSTTVTLIGLMLKRSLDARTLVLQTEAEERLKLDTAIKAVELFKSAAGSASQAESAGALFALSRLGQFHFALALLQELWPKDRINSPSATWVINSCLQSKDFNAVELAATVLLENAAKLPDGRGSKSWPVNYDWKVPNEMSLFVRRVLLMARIKSLLSQPFDYWDRSTLNSDILALSNCFDTDSSSHLKKTAAAFLAILTQIYDPRDKQLLYLSKGELSIEKMRAKIEKTYGTSFCVSIVSEQELETKLGAWVKRAPCWKASGPTAQNSIRRVTKGSDATTSQQSTNG
jgi:hypothetical protein